MRTGVNRKNNFFQHCLVKFWQTI